MKSAASSPRSSLLILFSIVILDLIGFGIVIPILPYYARAYGASATVLGLILTSYAGMQFLCAPLWGRLSDRIGRRRVMLVTIAGTSLSLLLLGFADSLLWLFVARLLGGGFGANVSVATAYVTDLTPEAERTRWMGLIGASFGIGFILGPAIGGGLAPLGYSVPMLVAGGLAAVNFVFAFFALIEPPRQQVEAAAIATPRLQLPQGRLVRRLCLAYFVFCLGVNQLESVFAFFMMDRFDYDARRVAYILVAMGLVMAAIQGGAIRGLAARFGERRLMISGSLLLGASFVVIPWIPLVAVLLVPLLVSSVGRAISQPAMLSMVSSAASIDHRGAVLGTFQSSASLARVLGPLAAGALYDLHYGAPFLLAAVLMAVVLGFGVALPAAAEPG